LLLGSGVSRAAQIPTGWEVLENLIRKLAHEQKKKISGEPAEWYRSETGEEPNYSKILQELASSKAERQTLLKSYFEPTEEEQEEGKKMPTKAHKAIAQLVRRGVVRVILTTNFDRLLETALADEGVTPTVLSMPEAMEGAPPLVHTPCTLIKLHGDYLDTRIRNTETELEEYPPQQECLLRQVLDEYGLVVCGWSAEWDTALVDALSGSKNQRYTTFWAAWKGDLADAAKALVQHRQARVIPIDDADLFFETVADRLEALEEFDRPHPISKEIAVAQLKKYLPEERHKIRLYDLLHEETERVYSDLSVDNFPIDGSVPFDAEHLAERLARYEAIVEILEAMLAVGAYWGADEDVRNWIRVLERVACPEYPLGSHRKEWVKLQWYPATRLVYAAGLAALAAENYGVLWKLLSEPKARREGEEPTVLAFTASPWCVDHGTLNQIMNAKYHVPGSEWLFATLRESFRQLVPSDEEWEILFDRFEYLKALASIQKDKYIYLGRFGYRASNGLGPAREIPSQIGEQREEWPPLAQGFFGGSFEDLQAATIAISQAIDSRSWY